MRNIMLLTMTTLMGLVDVNAGNLLEKFQSSNKARPKYTRHTDLVRVYRYSSHARALEAQKRAYRSSAIKNAEVFSGRNAIINRKPYDTIYRKEIPLYRK